MKKYKINEKRRIETENQIKSTKLFKKNRCWSVLCIWAQLALRRMSTKNVLTFYRLRRALLLWRRTLENIKVEELDDDNLEKEQDEIVEEEEEEIEEIEDDE